MVLSHRSMPGEKAVPNSPIVKTMNLIHHFFKREPKPDINSQEAKGAGILAGNHLQNLMSACGLLNGSGSHSTSVSLLRLMEDALDIFAAVTIVPGAAKLWLDRKLCPSDAAKAWIKVFRFADLPENELSEYRKTLRGQFAKYAHCSFDLCSWDLFHDVREVDSNSGRKAGPVEVNIDSLVIDKNAHAIDAHLTAHLLEFIEIVKFAYTGELSAWSQGFDELQSLETSVREIMDKHNEHRCQDVQTPPELRHLI